MSDLPVYVLEREFAAPRELVWKAWTTPERLNRWYGPGVETTIHKFDLQADGEWLNEMNWGGNSNYQKMVFQSVLSPEKLVWHHYSNTDANWNSSANPMMPDWPALLLTEVSFTEAGDNTLVRLSQTPVNASDAEIACFAKMMSNMDKGWGAGFDIIVEILSER